ncbi:unnamed protein product, partial [Didymodactylos carnosus]
RRTVRLIDASDIASCNRVKPDACR